MIKTKIIPVQELEIGMFVEELDRPWLETPYPFQGIWIKSEGDILELSKYCQSVYVTPPKAPPKPFILKKPITHVIPEEDKKTVFHGAHVYKNNISLQKELPKAKQAHDKAQVLINEIKDGINRDFTLNTAVAKELVDVIAKSVINNPDAMLLLNGLKNKDNGEYERALSTSIYLITFGRHLCLPSDELAVLGLGGLLMDIGKIKLLSNPDVDIADINVRNKITEQHVRYGQEILASMEGIPEKVLEITSQHHEREDRSGYPNRLTGNEISPYARMAAIVDCYLTLTLEGLNEDTAPLTPFQSLNVLWDWTRNWLNATLVQSFAHCIGLCPVGSLVELNSGEVAVVLSHSRSNRLKPLVMLILDSEKKPFASPKTLDLSTNKVGPNGLIYQISNDLPAGAYNIDPTKYYI